jgi:hypothetical protein
MMGRETGVTAAGVGLRRSAGEATGALVRPLGAFERLYHRRQQKSTMLFCMVAELADDIDPCTLAAALRAVQQRHPLLNVYVKDHPQTGLGFHRPASVPPIPIAVIDAEAGRSWRDCVAAEFTRPFDTSRAPMIRVVLLRSGPSTRAVIVLANGQPQTPQPDCFPPRLRFGPSTARRPTSARPGSIRRIRSR